MRDFGKKAAVVLLALALSVMMVPATAFADIGGDSYQVEVDASQADASHTSGEDVTADGKPAVGVLADNGHTAEVEVGDVTASSYGKHAVMVEVNGGGTADVKTGNITENYGPVGVSASASGGGTAVIETGDIALTRNYYATKNAALDANATGEGSTTTVTAGNVTGAPKYGNGIDVSTKGGNVEVTAKDVKGYKIGLNVDNAPGEAAAAFTGEKRVTVDSVTQTYDSRYSDAGINAFSYTKGDVVIVHVKGDVNAAASRAVDVQAVGGGDTQVAVDGTVTGTYMGVKIVAGSLGTTYGGSVSTGTANVCVGGVVSNKWDRGVEIDSNTKGSILTFQSDGDVKAVASGSTGIFARADGGKTSITVDGDLSGTKAGIFIYSVNGGANDVLVTGTISGKNGVDISIDSVDNDSLTVWKIDKAANGQYVSSEWIGVPSDDREKFAKKRISYIVKMIGSASAEAANLRAAKNLGGAALDQNHGYDVAKEGTRVYLLVDPGYKIAQVTNLDENQTVQQDANGNYYIVVKRGGGIDLFVTIEGDEDEFLTIMPDAESIVTGAQLYVGPSDDAPVFNLPYLTDAGVVINEVKLKMDGQTPVLRTMLTNANDHDVDFDSTKFKVVNADNEKEIAFKTKSQELKAGEANVECAFEADANAMKAGDTARVYYDDQLLGTFTVE